MERTDPAPRPRPIPLPHWQKRYAYRRASYFYMEKNESNPGRSAADRQKSMKENPLSPICQSIADGVFTVNHEWRTPSFKRAASASQGFPGGRPSGRNVFISPKCQGIGEQGPGRREFLDVVDSCDPLFFNLRSRGRELRKGGFSWFTCQRSLKASRSRGFHGDVLQI
jgi:hypothetical protein